MHYATLLLRVLNIPNSYLYNILLIKYAFQVLMPSLTQPAISLMSLYFLKFPLNSFLSLNSLISLSFLNFP